MFDRVLNQSMGHYVWEQVFGKFNLFFKKYIHPWEMFIVECYIFVGYRPTEPKKKKNIHYSQLLDCSPSFDCFLYFLTV